MNSSFRHKSILADTHYSITCLNDICAKLSEEIDSNFPTFISRCARKSGIVRGVLFWWLGQKYDLIVTAVHHPGWSIVLILQAFLGRERKIVLLEFLIGRPTVFWRRIIYSLWLKIIIKPSLRRALKSAQALTAWEQKHYAHQFGINIEQFYFIPFWLRESTDILPSYFGKNNFTVMSSGRAACDWETLFKAADGTNWQLIVVCSKRDYSIIKKFNKNYKAKIFCEISTELHDQYLRSADVYVAALKEVYASAGQVRIKNAIRLGIPIVATAVKGLEGYLFDKVNALLVPPEDHVGLRHAIEKLLANQDYRRSISQKAFELAVDQTREGYRVKIRKFVEQSCEL